MFTQKYIYALLFLDIVYKCFYYIFITFYTFVKISHIIWCIDIIKEVFDWNICLRMYLNQKSYEALIETYILFIIPMDEIDYSGDSIEFWQLALPDYFQYYIFILLIYTEKVVTYIAI